ncbi:MAG: hypothetical protein ACOCVR_04470, partial [Myxococcota bacterium]
MTATIGQDALSTGPALVYVENPEPAACSGSNDDAFFLVPPPELAGVEPPAICADGEGAVLTLTGQNFVTVGAEKPVVTLSGNVIDPADVTPQDCTEVDAVGTTVGLCETVLVTFSTTMFTAGEEISVSITNPTPGGCADTYSDTLPVVAPPEITGAVPALVCTEDGSRSFVLEGQGFVSVDGALPTISFGGVEGSVDSLSGQCEDLTFGTLSAQSCTQAEVTAPAGPLAPGAVEVTLTNPAPLSCGMSSSTVLMAPPALLLTEAIPPSLCDGSGEMEVELRGDGFLIMGAEEPEVRLDGVVTTPVSIEGCTPIDLPDGTSIQSCSSINVMFNPDGLGGPVSVRVTNPDSGQDVPGCAVESSDILAVGPPPTVSTVAPSAFCEGGAVSLTLGGEGFTQHTSVWLTGDLGDLPAASVTFDSDTQLTASWVEGEAPPDSYDVSVSNGPGCESTLLAAVDVMPTPLVFFVDPEVVYDGMSTQVTIYVSGLTADASEISLMGPSGQMEILTGSAAPDDPNKIIATIPENLEAGAWDVVVVSQEGCVGELTGGLEITDSLTVAIDSISPDYVSPSEPTAVTVNAVESLDPGFVDFQDTPRLYLNPAGATGAVAAPLSAVVFVDTKTLTAVVPGGMDPGVYDLIAVNPDGSAGVLDDALTVTLDEPPVVSVVVPGTLTNDAGDHFAELRGSNFDAVGGVSVSMLCRAPDGTKTGELAAVVDDASLTESSVSANFPTENLLEDSVCVIKLTNSDGASFRYSAVSIKNPSYNLSPWTAVSPMNEARRAHSLVAGRPTEASRYLYAMGGDEGDGTALKTSVEQVSVGLFGDLGSWRYGRTELPAGRTFAGVARIG